MGGGGILPPPPKEFKKKLIQIWSKFNLFNSFISMKNSINYKNCDILWDTYLYLLYYKTHLGYSDLNNAGKN